MNVEAADRGRLEIHPQVLRKIVEHAADQVPGTVKAQRSVAGVGVGETGAGARVRPGAGSPTAVDVRLELTLAYPTPVPATVAAVRRRIRTELDRLAGHQVRELRVTVSGLHYAPAAPRLR